MRKREFKRTPANNRYRQWQPGFSPKSEMCCCDGDVGSSMEMCVYDLPVVVTGNLPKNSASGIRVGVVDPGKSGKISAYWYF